MPKGNTPYEVWFGRPPPTDNQIYYKSCTINLDNTKEVEGEELARVDKAVIEQIKEEEKEGFMKRGEQAKEETELISSFISV